MMSPKDLTGMRYQGEEPLPEQKRSTDVSPATREIGPFTDSSIDAASFIYEDCRARGQSAEEAMRKALRRLIPSAAPASFGDRCRERGYAERPPLPSEPKSPKSSMTE